MSKFDLSVIGQNLQKLFEEAPSNFRRKRSFVFYEAQKISIFTQRLNEVVISVLLNLINSLNYRQFYVLRCVEFLVNGFSLLIFVVYFNTNVSVRFNV